MHGIITRHWLAGSVAVTTAHKFSCSLSQVGRGPRYIIFLFVVPSRSHFAKLIIMLGVRSPKYSLWSFDSWHISSSWSKIHTMDRVKIIIQQAEGKRPFNYSEY